MSDETLGNERQAEYWEDRSSSWIAVEEWTTLVTGSFGLHAMNALALEAGQHVVDIGCGTGPTTVELARRVAPGGTVLGLDIAPSMIAAAQQRAANEHVDNVEFRVGDAQRDDLGTAKYDAVFSQFGVMFFADPTAAFTNLRSTLREGGKIGFACWQNVFENEWMLVPGMALMSVTGSPPPLPAPGEPGPFSLSDPAVVEQILAGAGAGFASIEIVPTPEQIVTGADRVDMAVDAASRVGGVREALEQNDDPAFHDEVRAAVRAALLERVHEGKLRLGAAAFVVTAVCPG